MKTHHHLALCSLAALGLTMSCGDNDNDDKNPVEEAVGAGFNFAKDSDIPGKTFVTPCQNFSPFEGVTTPISSEESWAFGATNTNITKGYNLFADGNCQNSIGSVEILGNYELKGEENGVHPINLKFDKAWVTPGSDILATAFNTIKWCGIANWASGTKQEVTDAAGKGACKVTEVIGITTFDVVKVDGDNLFLGTPFKPAPENEADRPKEVDQAINYAKK